MQPPQYDLLCPAAKDNSITHAAAPSNLEAAATTSAHTRYPSSPAEATLHGKTQGFVLQLSPLTQAPCNVHATITMRFAALRGKHASLYARGNKT